MSPPWRSKRGGKHSALNFGGNSTYGERGNTNGGANKKKKNDVHDRYCVWCGEIIPRQAHRKQGTFFNNLFNLIIE
jgi:hypothetical protein